MKAILSIMNKTILGRSSRVAIWSMLLVVAMWCLTLLVLNRNAIVYQWLISDIDSLRTLLGSIFQGLASFFAIIISVSLLVAQLTYGSFSPRLMPNFLKSGSFLAVIFLFVGSLSLNAFLLFYLSEQTICILLPLVTLDLIVSLVALISVVPASFVLLGSAHPMEIGWELIERFNDAYFNEVPFRGGESPRDDSLPLLQSLIIKSIREADTDYAQRLLGSFVGKVEGHLNEDNAVQYAGYFDSFLKKVAFISSQENEESVLQQLVFANESFEKKASKSKKYLSNSDTRYESSFARNILNIIELSMKNRHNRVFGIANGAMHRLREVLVQSIPIDEEITSFRTTTHFQEKREGEIENTDIHFFNERVYEYIDNIYFGSNSAMAFEALRLHNTEAIRYFARDIFHSRHSLGKLDPLKHKGVINRIAFNDFYNLSKLSQLSVKNNISISEEIAVGIYESRDFFLKVDPRLAESYVDLLGQLMIDTTEKEVPNSDPNTTFWFAGVALRTLLHSAPANIPLKLLAYFDKVLTIIVSRQLKSFSPILEKLRETICEEIASVRKYPDSDASILKKAEEILANYPDVTLRR